MEFPLHSTRLRLVTLFCIAFALIAFTSFATKLQQAKGSFSRDRLGTEAPVTPADGGLTPAAATITVNSTSDASNSSDGLCTLREAIAAAIINSPSGSTPGECAAGSSGPDVISLAGLTGVITLATNMSALTGEITINGPGAGSLTVTRSSAGGTPNFRIFTIGNSGVVTISGLTISNGSVIGAFPSNSGGAIWNNHGDLTIKDCVLTGNSANASSPSGFGGAIYNDGSTFGTATLTIVNSTISSNSCTGSGGAIYNNGGNGSATLTISNSTIDSNTAANGGGIYNTGQQGNAPVQITNSTISGNTAQSAGGFQKCRDKWSCACDDSEFNYQW